MDKPTRKPRNRQAENASAKDGLVRRVTEIVASRHEGRLGDDYIKIAQAMILCTLPYSEQLERQITRRARLGDGTYLAVTFTAGAPGVPVPFGADRKLLAWIFDRAIRSGDPFVSWESASEYQREMGIAMGGRANRQLNERFKRVAGLVINIQRHSEGPEHDDVTYPARQFSVIEDSWLPPSIAGTTIEADERQRTLPELRNRFGVQLNARLFADIRKHNVVLPRDIWREIKGTTQVQDLVFWLIFRCYSARSPTVIPWAALKEQFPQDSNPWRLRSNTREAIRILRALWPPVRLEEVEAGIAVDYTPEPLLPDDISKGRVRRNTRSS